MDSIPPYKQKELFREYKDDYNTATLPNEKFYDMTLWEHNQLQTADTTHASADPMSFDFDDEELVCIVFSGSVRQHSLFLCFRLRQARKDSRRNAITKQVLEEQAAARLAMRAREADSFASILTTIKKKD